MRAYSPAGVSLHIPSAGHSIAHTPPRRLLHAKSCSSSQNPSVPQVRRLRPIPQTTSCVVPSSACSQMPSCAHAQSFTTSSQCPTLLQTTSTRPYEQTWERSSPTKPSCQPGSARHSTLQKGQTTPTAQSIVADRAPDAFAGARATHNNAVVAAVLGIRFVVGGGMEVAIVLTVYSFNTLGQHAQQFEESVSPQTPPNEH